MKFYQVLNGIFFALALPLASAFAVQGGETGGGGNTLNGLLIESYIAKNISTDLPEFEEAKVELLNQLKNLAPDFATKLEKNIAERNWYLIPRTFKNLSSQITGLDFGTDQSAYQNEDEVFLSLPSLETMAIEARKNLFKHEIIMTALTNKNAATHTSVRNIMNLLGHQDLSAVKFCNELENNNLGKYMTKDEINLYEKYTKIVSVITQTCSGTQDPEFKQIYQHLTNIVNNRERQSVLMGPSFDLLERMDKFYVHCRF